MDLDFDRFAALVPSLLAGVLMFAEAHGLEEGWGWVHRLGVPIAEGEGALDALALRQMDGAHLVRIESDDVGYWSTLLRFGVHVGGLGARYPALGIMCSGTLSKSEGGHVRWVERVRLPPLFLVAAVSVAGMDLWKGVPLWVLAFPPISFGLIYSVCCAAVVAETRILRRRLFGA